MTAAGGKRALLTAALLVAGIRLWSQVRGKTKSPFAEWAIGWGATFFLLSVMSEASPQAAGMLSLTIVTGDLLVNGTSLFEDVSGAITGAEKGTQTLSPQPFGQSLNTGPAPGPVMIGGVSLSTIPRLHTTAPRGVPPSPGVSPTNSSGTPEHGGRF